ncbi:hypothetical protein [Streptomyces roseicoloratus]|uniref:Gram-positive cocci surface proteins LPxTG domain-containing protein n=1 Tax=Streptomyces roseicoloratus TaxID=2508722 RepID=A0ABY9RV60_9ACTN|nr:hypothetical protein [Streptomyces roseicoloratus]WMX45376.1 hypothetical protein RGF97_11665 [Streptomyces roseicoloratus]
MRTALRTAVVTALLAGLATAPAALAAGTAFAADGPAATAENPATGTLVRTETLSHGTVVKVYKLGPTWYRADSFKHGTQPIGSVEANGRPAAGNDNGDYLVLFEDGRTLAWRGNAAQTGTSGLYRLVDGTVLELDRQATKAGLQLVENGAGRGFTYAVNGVENRRVLRYGKAVVVLEHDGGFAAYVEGAARQAAPLYLGPRDDQKPAPRPGTVLSGPTANGCTVTEKIASVYPYWTVTLTNDVKKGPKAVLKDEKGTVRETVDRAHPGPTGLGQKIVGADTATPRYGHHTNGGDTAPYRWTDFPKLPKSCTTAPTTAPTSTPATGTGTATGSAAGTGTRTQGGQTSVVPKGGVAAGAEFGSTEQANDTALYASAGGAAAVVAAGLGFTVLRRRAAAPTARG